MTPACGCPVSGTDACQCGNGHPPTVTNPPGLAEIAYRVNDFAGFRRALLTGLPGEQQLSGWSPGPADLGQQIVEWWAYLGDILTFYNQLIANNDYLRTAVTQPRPNVAGLVRLLGYPARPAITASGYIAAIRSASAPQEKLVIPAGMQITSTPTAGSPAQLFETDDAAKFDGPSVVPIGLTPLPALFQAAGGDDKDKSVLLAGSVTIQSDRSLLLVSRIWNGTNGGWAVATVSSAETETAPDGTANTRVVLQSEDWTGIPPQTAANSAEPKAGAAQEQPGAEPGASTPRAKPAPEPAADDYRLQKATATALLWTLPTNLPVQKLPAMRALPAGGGGKPAQPTVTVQLAALVRGIAPGDNVLVIPGEGEPILVQVTEYQEQLEPVAPATGPATRVFVPSTLLTVRTGEADISRLSSAVSEGAASTTVQYGFRDVGTLIPTPRASLDKLGDPELTSVQSGFTVPGGILALEDAAGTGMLVTAAAGTGGSVRLDLLDRAADTRQILDPPLQAPIQLLAALVPVSRGATVADEILGDGDPTVASQAFTLQHSPLIFLPPTTPGDPPGTTLSVYVDGVLWFEEAAFDGQSGKAPVYVVRQLADGGIQVCFGDGVNGARLPRGIGNVTATYRYGPSVPPPPPGRLSTVLQPQPNLATVRSPVPMTPGTNPEPATLTADNAPPTVVLLGPPISPGDCEQIAGTVDGVTRVRAYWSWDQDRRSPGVTLYLDDAAAVPGVRDLLPATTWRIPVAVMVAEPVYLSITGRLRLVPGTPAAEQPKIQDAAIAALLDPAAGLFSPQRMAIGQRLYRSQVETALSVSGVRAVLDLRIQRTEPAPARESYPASETSSGPATKPGSDPSLDLLTDEYFQVRKGDLHIGVVPDG